MHLMLIMEMIVVMKVIMKVVHEDEEITHFVGSKNIDAAQEKNNNQDNLIGTSIHCSLGRQDTTI